MVPHVRNLSVSWLEDWLVGPPTSVCCKGRGKLHFHAPIGALVPSILPVKVNPSIYPLWGNDRHDDDSRSQLFEDQDESFHAYADNADAFVPFFMRIYADHSRICDRFLKNAYMRPFKIPHNSGKL